MKNPIVTRKDLIYPLLSYQIIGILFDVYNVVGPGHHEKYYQRAIAKAFTDAGLKFRAQEFTPLHYRGQEIGRQFCDFIVEDKVILEIKKGDKFSKRHIDQTLDYLKTRNLKLAILANFAREGVVFKRIVNAV